MTHYLIVFFISMVPLIELRGSIPLGALFGMDWPTVFVISVVGNLLPVPFIVLFGRPLFRWLKSTRLLSGLSTRIENRPLRGRAPAGHRGVVGRGDRRAARDAYAPRAALDHAGRTDRRGHHDGGVLRAARLFESFLTAGQMNGKGAAVWTSIKSCSPTR